MLGIKFILYTMMQNVGHLALFRGLRELWHIGSEFDINTDFTNYEPKDLRYVNPIGYKELLNY